MTNKKVKKCFVCLKLVKKNQNILSCSTCLQTIYFNCIKDKFCITKNMLWKCTFCSFIFPFSSCSDKEFAELFDFDISNLFYSANHLNNLFKNLSWLGALCSSLIAAIQNQKVNHYLILFTAHLFTYSNRIKNKIKIKTNNYNNKNDLV